MKRDKIYLTEIQTRCQMKRKKNSEMLNYYLAKYLSFL